MRPASSGAPAALWLALPTGSVSLSAVSSQSVINSRRDQSTPVVAEFGRSLAAGRYAAVANKVANKVLI